MAMKTISDIINSKKMSRDYRCSHEFQAYGNKLSEDLGDKKHRALYIKLAKTEDRSLLEEAKDSVLSSRNATTKGRLFMWKVGQLKKERKEKQKENAENSKVEKVAESKTKVGKTETEGNKTLPKN